MAIEETGSDPVNVLDEIFENAAKALFVAELLDDEAYREYALHFAIICCEECSKYLLVYCKNHLPKEHFSSRYKHVPKHAIASSLYFLSGELSVIYQINELHDSDVWKEGKDGLAALVSLSLDNIGMGNPERLAMTLMEFLSAERNEDEKAAQKESYANTEGLRTQSVYVDVNDDLSIKSSPRQIASDTAKFKIEHAKLGVAILAFLRSPHPDFAALIKSFPDNLRNDVETQANEMISKMREAATDSEAEN